MTLNSRSQEESPVRLLPILYFLHGPHRVPISKSADDGYFTEYHPFHGIISRGMMQTLNGLHVPVDWTRYSASLDTALAGNDEQASLLPDQLLDIARSCEVLSFADSVSAAEAIVRWHLPDVVSSVDLPFELSQVSAVELWNVKEGHTSSVWKVTLFSDQGENSISFALNVARDSEAGKELLDSAAILQEITPRISSAGIARVLFAARISLPKAETASVATVVQEWIEDSYELGYLPDRMTHRHQLFAIDRFLMAPDAHGRIVSVAGRRLESQEQASILSQILMAMLEASRYDPASQQVCFPSFELNEGDWVLSQGRAFLVAVSTKLERMNLNAALEYYLNYLSIQYGVADAQNRSELRRLAWQVIQTCLGKGFPVWLGELDPKEKD
jgi:hypothetical protein